MTHTDPESNDSSTLVMPLSKQHLSVCTRDTHLSPGPNDGQFLHGGGTLVVQLGAGFACVELGQR